jgi:YfiR/HmsC-like
MGRELIKMSSKIVRIESSIPFAIIPILCYNKKIKAKIIPMKELKIRFILIFCLLAMMAFSYTSTARTNNRTAVEKPENLTAVFVLRFSNLSKWPENSTVKDLNSPFIIGILENPILANTLKEYAKHQKVQGKLVNVINIALEDFSDVKKCNVLFIPKFSRKKIKSIMEALEKLPILTIGDTKDYEKKGVMINLFKSSNQKLKFNVNCLAANNCGIKLTSQIVRWAKNRIR